MKKKFLFLFLVLLISLVFAVSCSDDEGGDVEVKVNCNSNIDCNRDSYCDLENPQQDAELGTIVYHCKKRMLCASQADCPMYWVCMESEGICITNKEADGILCKSNDDCEDPDYPICNLAKHECEPAEEDGGGNDLPDSPDIPEQDDEDSADNDPTDKDDDDTADSEDDRDTDTADTSEGKQIFKDSFEDGGANWTKEPASEGAQSCWEIGTPVNGPAAANVGSKTAFTVVSEGSYLGGCKDLLRYNSAIDIPSSGKPEISFYAWVDLVASGDYVEVLVKEDGELWDAATGIYLSADTPSITSALDTSRTKITGQLATAYYEFTGDISAYKGKKVEIAFRFVSDNDSNDAKGFYLDDVAVSY